MYVQIDITPVRPVVSLEEPDDCTRFHLAVVGGRDVGASSAHWSTPPPDGSKAITR